MTTNRTMMKPIFFIVLFALTCAQDQDQENTTKKPVKRSYVCPPHFIRLSHRCYYFSTEVATWQDAYYHCRDLHSNLATVKNANQDKLIRRTLSKKTLQPLERWLGGRYDWEQMSWKWAASGKPVTFQGFDRMDSSDKERLLWHCLTVDPRLQYKWNARSCLEEKHYICQTKIKVVGNKGKKKLLRQYNVDKYNKLNEIPVPTIHEDVYRSNADLKGHQLNNVDLHSEYALKAKPRKKKNRKGRKKKILANDIEVSNVTAVFDLQREQADEREKAKKRRRNRMEWRTYLKSENPHPLHPKAIIEEYNYIKES